MKAFNPQRIYTIAMWLVSLVFASFLIGLGELVISDLPKYSQAEQLQELGGHRGRPQSDPEDAAMASEVRALQNKLTIAQSKLDQAQRNFEMEDDAHKVWLLTREVTASSANASDQDAELISRTRRVQEVADRHKQALAVRDQLSAEIQIIEQGRQLRAYGRKNSPEAIAKQRHEDLKNFGLRLALTLPLLAASGWMIARRRKSAYWPLYRGFVIFAAVAFFVELVPHLPSYGGYVREVVGIVICLVGGHYGIRWMQSYLRRREEATRQSELERRKSMNREEALQKMVRGLCPGCDRAISAPIGAEKVNHCVHCGLKLFDHCVAEGCGTRKNAYYAHCQACGHPSAPNGQDAP